MRTVAITGASGYVGSMLAEGVPAGLKVVRLVRRPQRDGELAWSLSMNEADTTRLLRDAGVSDLIHAAWDMTESSAGKMRDICVEGSGTLFRAARLAGVTRTIFISTISAFEGASSAYGASKYAVEDLARQEGLITLRLGLVHGDGNGGMFGAIRSSVHRSRILPMIGLGRLPQYLLPADVLTSVIVLALSGALDGVTEPITVANPKPVPFSELVRDIARREGRSVFLLPVPWPLLWAGLAAMERLGLRPPMRSDSVLSFVRPNECPDFTLAQKVGALPPGSRSTSMKADAAEPAIGQNTPIK